MTKKNFKFLILTCWALLLICLVIKLFGGNWFELNSENTKFIQFCNYVDNTMWLKMGIACNNYIFTGYPVICIALNQKHLTIKQTLIFIPLMIFKSIISWYFRIFAGCIDMIILIVLPLLLKRFKNWKRVLLINILIIVLQVMTMIIRNIGFSDSFNYNLTIINSLLQIDYYIMIILCYLYNTKYFINKKEN